MKNFKTKNKSIRLYEVDIEKINKKINNKSKFLRFCENRYYYILINNSKKLLDNYNNYIKNYDIKKTKILSYQAIVNNKLYTRQYLTAFIHYNLNELLKNYKEF